jgi:ABC-type spermidine/putrescine transport system permease subunit II
VSLSPFVTKGETLPLRLMQHIQFQPDPTIAAVSTTLVAVSLVFMVLFVRVLSRQQLDALETRHAH